MSRKSLPLVYPVSPRLKQWGEMCWSKTSSCSFPNNRWVMGMCIHMIVFSSHVSYELRAKKFVRLLSPGWGSEERYADQRPGAAACSKAGVLQTVIIMTVFSLTWLFILRAEGLLLFSLPGWDGEERCAGWWPRVTACSTAGVSQTLHDHVILFSHHTYDCRPSCEQRGLLPSFLRLRQWGKMHWSKTSSCSLPSNR